MKEKPIHYTHHALERLLERGITKERVESAIRQPTRRTIDEKGEPIENSVYRLEKDDKKRKLIILLYVYNDYYVIKTAFWSSLNQ